MRPPTKYRRQLDQQSQGVYCAGIRNILMADDAFGNALGLFNWCVILIMEKIAGKKPTIELERHVCCLNIPVCRPNVMQEASKEVRLI